jgi:hypothetical protein
MVDAHFDFMICNVPSEETVSLIARDIEAMLLEKHGTEIYIYPTMESD